MRERLDADGCALLALGERDVRRAAKELRSLGVETVAICFLHSYRNPVHERRAAAILEELLPNVPLSLSSSVAPELREYPRASTTVINAAIQPVVAHYPRWVEAALRGLRLGGKLLLMQSSGGVIPFASDAERPISIVESGPAASVMAAAHLGKTLDCAELVSLDMGGTTAKAGLLRNGSPEVTREYEVGRPPTPGPRGCAAGGIPSERR